MQYCITTRIRLLNSSENPAITSQLNLFRKFLEKCNNVQILDLTSFNFQVPMGAKLRINQDRKKLLELLLTIFDYSKDHKWLTHIRIRIRMEQCLDIKQMAILLAQAQVENYRPKL